MNDIRNDFPILSSTNRGKPLVYLDSASSAQKPKIVVEAMSSFYYNDYANIHRGIYELSERATKHFEDTRAVVKQFIHAPDVNNIVFVKGTTEGINLLASTLSQSWVAGDEVILSEMEHHSNIVPWVMLKEKLGIVLKIIPVTDEGALDLTLFESMLTPKTKCVSITHASNVLGTINPIKHITAIAHQHTIPVIIDGAQAAPHLAVDVQDLDCDFYVFSSHKCYGPTGVGVLYAKSPWLNTLPPYQGGGDMIETVAFDKVTYAKAPHKFEAGTPDIAGVIGLNAALQYLMKHGMQTIAEHEQQLLSYATNALMKIPDVRLIGTAIPKLGVISFVMDGVHPHDMGTVLDAEGVAVRASHHCAMPLMTRFGVPATVRASFGIYNNTDDVDALIRAIHEIKRLFG
jgi:cysteine desulfurase/selenocysteine lyase